MAVRHAMALGAFSLALFSAAAHAGPCTSQIYDADVAISKRLNAAAAAGKTAPETQGALLHHQPTPQSVARAEAGPMPPSASSVMPASGPEPFVPSVAVNCPPTPWSWTHCHRSRQFADSACYG